MILLLFYISIFIVIVLAGLLSEWISFVLWPNRKKRFSMLEVRVKILERRLENFISPIVKAFKSSLFESLEACSTTEEINEVFGKYGVESFEKRSEYLMNCMGVEEPDTTASISPEEDYAFTCAAFLSGVWRTLA